MVQVTSYAVRERKDGTTFITLELTGSLELIQNRNGGFYATTRKCSLPSTFDEPVAKMMIGQQLEGDIVRVASDPYDYVNKRTGEVMQLTHRYGYRPKGAVELIGITAVRDVQVGAV